MQKAEKIDFAKLFGFQTVSDQISGRLDFQDEIIGDKLGAKVGMEDNPGASAARLTGD